MDGHGDGALEPDDRDFREVRDNRRIPFLSRAAYCTRAARCSDAKDREPERGCTGTGYISEGTCQGCSVSLSLAGNGSQYQASTERLEMQKFINLPVDMQRTLLLGFS